MIRFKVFKIIRQNEILCWVGILSSQKEIFHKNIVNHYSSWTFLQVMETRSLIFRLRYNTFVGLYVENFPDIYSYELYYMNSRHFWPSSD